MKKSTKTKLSLMIMALSTFLTPNLHATYEVLEDKMPQTIKTPSLSDVKKQKIRLSNGLEALIISDPQTPKSGAALAVGVGNAHEPFEKVGVAHFVEHMLFMGTKKYPIEKEYHEFIQQNGGMNNAYTASDRTVYMYEINNAQMSEALDRFASFFCEPLFNESSLNRERLAVDQEFSHRAINDHLRSYLVFLNQIDEKHPLSQWRCGTRQTLEPVTREELVNWYQSHYGANRMKLVVYSSQSLEEMVKQVNEAFSPIKPCHQELAQLSTPALKPENLGKKVYIKPLKDLKTLNLFWEVDAKYLNDTEYHTMDLVGDALSEESPNSLATYLKQKGLIQEMSAGGFSLTSSVGFFNVSVQLTEKGVQEHEQIITTIFEALKGLKQEGIPRYRFEEKVNVAKLNYEYQSRPNVFRFLSDSSAQLLQEDIASFPRGNLWPTSFSQERNQEFLSALTPHQAVYLITAPEQLVHASFDQTENTARVSFSREKIDPTQLQAWNDSRANNQLRVAAPNPYVTNHVVLVNKKGEDQAPEKLIHDEMGCVYYAPDRTYQVPKAHYSLRIHSPAFNPDAKSQVYKELYLLSLNDALAEQADQGAVAGINHQVSFDQNYALNLLVHGYSQKSRVYMQKLLQTMLTHQTSERDFQRYKERLNAAVQNSIKRSPPLKQASTMVSSLIFKEFISDDEKAEVMDSITYESYSAFCEEAFKEVFIKSLFYGNLKKEDAYDLYQDINQAFSSSMPYPEDQIFKKSVLELNNKQSPKYLVKKTDVEGNAVMLMINHGEMNFKKSAALSVYANSVSVPFFDTLRTKQQTGYVVQSQSQELERQLFSFYMVLSNSHSTRDLLARFELFNEEFLTALNSPEYSQEKFDSIKQSIITRLEHPPKSLFDNAQRLEKYAYDYEGDFNRHEKMIAALNELSFEEFLEFSKEQFGRQNLKRFAALVDGKISPEKQFEYSPIQDFLNFKTQMIYTSADIIAENQKVK